MKRKSVLSMLSLSILAATSIFAFAWKSQETTSSVQVEKSGRQQIETYIENEELKPELTSTPAPKVSTTNYIGEEEVAGISEVLAKAKVIEEPVKEPEPMYKLTKDEKEMLYRITEAECTGQSKIAKQNIAVVILNRVNDSSFPDTIEKVIFQKSNREYQFSPIKDKRYFEVDIKDSTKEAVDEIIQYGTDDELIVDALYFFNEGDIKSQKIKNWITRKLKYLTKDDSGHSFYKEK